MQSANRVARSVLSRADQLSPPPKPISRVQVMRRVWSGVCVDVTECWGHGEACAQLGYEAEARLWALMEEVGGAHCEARFKPEQSCPVSYTPRNMHFAPRGLAAWGYCADLRYTRDATLVFEVGELESRWGQVFDAAAFSAPRWRFADDGLWTLVKLLADAVNDPDPASELYGDGLVTAILARLGRHSAPLAPKQRGLAHWQLRKVIDYLEARLPEAVQLTALAELTGLSQAHFARAFKASTGSAPYQWQLRARIERAKTLLLQTDGTLDDVAVATGFADAVHFGRTFRRVVGATPANWRRSRKS
jgi:AraC family transcriptional regulator